MEKMQFKEFVWPQNPETTQIKFVRPVLFERKMDGTVEFFGLGPGCRTLTGKGVFSGNSAYADFLQLSNLLYEKTPGVLRLPIWQDWYAFLTEITAIQEPREKYVAYSFTFREADANGNILNDSEGILVQKP